MSDATPRAPNTEKWKPKLLASSLPLEYEAAKILESNGHSANADYSYHRWREGRDVEFSVDIRSIHVTPAPEQSMRGCWYDMLVECKQRTRSVVWFFLPGISDEPEHQTNDIVLGVDAFSKWSLTDLQWWTTSAGMPTCYKGVEIDLSTGHVESAELRHGLLQLQFALPVLLRARLDTPATSLGVSDNTPLMFTPVLLTNAPLMVAHREFSAAAVDSAADISKLGEPVDCLAVRLSPGRDFVQHCQRHFAGFKDTVARKGMRIAEEHRRAQGVHAWHLPSSLADRLAASGEEINEVIDCSSIVVCRIPHFPQFVRKFTAIADQVAKTAVLEIPKHLRL